MELSQGIFFFLLILFRESFTDLHKHNLCGFLGFSMGLLTPEKEDKNKFEARKKKKEISTSRKKILNNFKIEILNKVNS